MSKPFVLAVLAALSAAGFCLPQAHAQSKPRAGGHSAKPSVWSPTPASSAPRQLQLPAPAIPNRWQPELNPPMPKPKLTRKDPIGLKTHIPHAVIPDYRPAPIAKPKVPVTKSTAKAPGKAPPSNGNSHQSSIKTQVIQIHQPRPTYKPSTAGHPSKPVQPTTGKPANPKNPPHPVAVRPTNPTRPPRPVPAIPNNPQQPVVVAHPILGSQPIPYLSRPRPRPTVSVGPPSGQNSNNQAAEEPRIRVHVRSGPGRVSGPTPQVADAGNGVPKISIDELTGNGNWGGDDGPVGGGAQALTADESRGVAEARDRFGDGNLADIISPEQDALIAAGLDAIATGQPLTDEQRQALLNLVAMPHDRDPNATDVWDRLNAELNADADDIRGAIYRGIQEEAVRMALAAGAPVGSVPVLPGQVNSDLAALADTLRGAPIGGLVTAGQQAAAVDGIEAMLRGNVLSQEQRDGLTAVANASSDTNFRVATAVLGATDLRGSLLAGLQADATAQATAIGSGAPGQSVAANVAQAVIDVFTAIQGGNGGTVMVVPAFPMDPGVVQSDSGFAGDGLVGPAAIEPVSVDPSYVPAAEVTNDQTASGSPFPTVPGLESSGTSSVGSSTPAGPAPSPQPGPGEAKYDRRYVSVKNHTEGKLVVFVQYETISASSGDWKWYPNDPTGTEAVAYSLEPGQEVALKRDDWSVNARRVRIWAATEAGEIFDQFRTEDLWLVDEQPNGERYYIARETETFSLAFGEPPAAE